MRKMMRQYAAVAAMATGLLMAWSVPAAAQATIDINPGNVPTTAAAFTQDCDPNLGGGPYPNEDVWVFNLPGNPDTSGVFESVTATFSTPQGTVTVTIPTDGGEIVNDLGTSKAWIRLPAGWTLTGATATISGQADFFVLTHTCAASGTPTPTPTPTGSPTGQPTPTPTATGSPTGQPTPTPTATGSPTAKPTPTKSKLPVTGANRGSGPIGLAAAGVLTVAAGTVLVLARRRRGTRA
ncbi:LPXTG cell wall anchor domain-containing protein [Micromonospora sp. NPDC002575]|uniref:LPXTG cell wall anchor domain-containing protein n=1 Tax=Micromonospora sp. NPDC002575 TaxID=3364222 RepID=UPI0036AD09D9